MTDYSNSTRDELINEIERLKKSVKNKRFGVVWQDIPEAFDEQTNDKLAVLSEDPQNEIKNTESDLTHILIEGDNYHALTCLNYTHNGKVDFIYIDPPYNTENGEFIYKDKRIVKEYPDGKVVKKDDPFRHSYWLSFMHRRLELAKNLLKPSGAIFISIDNNELAQLKLLCDQIFLESNFIGVLVWRKKEGGGQTDQFFVTEHEYVLAYRKSDGFKWQDEEVLEAEAKYNYEDADGKYKAVRLAKWGNASRRIDRPKQYFPIKDPDGKNNYPIAPDGNDGRWRVGAKTMQRLITNDLIEWQKKNGQWVPYEKVRYETGKTSVIKERSILYEIGGTADGTKELTAIFHRKDTFPNPKPSSLVEFLIEYACPAQGLVVDFFAGSGTTANAVLNLNDQGANRQFILNTSDEGDIMSSVCLPRIKSNIETSSIKSSLKYYKTAFVGSNYILKADDNDAVTLALNAGELLALAENTLDQLEHSDFYQIYSNGKTATGVYFREELDEFDTFVSRIGLLNMPVVVYVFSWGEAVGMDGFSGYANVTLKTIPKPILEIYKSIYNLEIA